MSVLGGGEATSATSGKLAHVEEVLSAIKKYLYMDCQWYGQYMFRQRRALPVCYISILEMGMELSRGEAHGRAGAEESAK